MLTETTTRDRVPSAVTLWLDPVCPFSWNTARWLIAAAGQAGFEIDWQLLNLAVLNTGKELPEPQQKRMNDSRHVGRLMMALHEELGPDALGQAYLAFAPRYFDHAAAVDADLVDHVVQAVGAHRVGAAVLNDASFDEAVAKSHQRGQDALGEPAGSPLLTVDGHTVFGPVFTAVPADDQTRAVFDAVTALIRTEQFSQLHRPRTH